MVNSSNFRNLTFKDDFIGLHCALGLISISRGLLFLSLVLSKLQVGGVVGGEYHSLEVAAAGNGETQGLLHLDFVLLRYLEEDESSLLVT